MGKLDLKYFNESEYVIDFFDCYIKYNKEDKKTNIFRNAKISYATYSRVKKGESNAGDIIAVKLRKYFKYKKINSKTFDVIENKINEIYNKIYFKYNDKYTIEIQWLDNLLSQKTTLEPVLILFKLLILATINMPEKYKAECSILFLKIKPYMFVFKNCLKELYFIVELIFVKVVDDLSLKSDYSNDLVLQVLSTKMLEMNNVFASLYFAEKVAGKFLDNGNIKRYLLVMSNTMACHNKLKEYEKTKIQGINLLGTFNSLKYDDIEYQLCSLHLLIAYLNLNLYKEVINLLVKSNKFNMNDICCFMLASRKLGDVNYLLLNSKIQPDEIDKKQLITMLDDLDDEKMNILDAKYCISKEILTLLNELK